MKLNDFEIINVLNHNAILCKRDDDTFVFLGKGIGFNRKKGQIFNKTEEVQNTMFVLKQQEAEHYKELLNQVENKKLISVIQKVVCMANEEFDYRINDKLNISLLDHLNFAIKRQKSNIFMNYPFIEELKFMYPEEYTFSIKALNYINKELEGEIKFGDGELGFLVLHIHAAVKNKKISKVLRYNQIVYTVIKFIEDEWDMKLNKKSPYYARFIKHIEFAVHRSENNIMLENILLDNMKSKCKDEFRLAKKINSVLNTMYKINLDDNELGYLGLHIYNLKI